MFTLQTIWDDDKIKMCFPYLEEIKLPVEAYKYSADCVKLFYNRLNGIYEIYETNKAEFNRVSFHLTLSKVDIISLTESIKQSSLLNKEKVIWSREELKQLYANEEHVHKQYDSAVRRNTKFEILQDVKRKMGF